MTNEMQNMLVILTNNAGNIKFESYKWILLEGEEQHIFIKTILTWQTLLEKIQLCFNTWIHQIKTNKGIHKLNQNINIYFSKKNPIQIKQSN